MQCVHQSLTTENTIQVDSHCNVSTDFVQEPCTPNALIFLISRLFIYFVISQGFAQALSKLHT